MFRRAPFLEIKELADKGDLLVENGYNRLVRRRTKPPATDPGRPGGRAARLLGDEPTRIYFPMRMRPCVIHGQALCHLGTARTLSLLERFYWWVGMNAVTRFWVRKRPMCQARKTSRQTVRWPILTIALPSGPGIAIRVDCFGPLPTTPRENSYILLFTESRRTP